MPRSYFIYIHHRHGFLKPPSISIIPKKNIFCTAIFFRYLHNTKPLYSSSFLRPTELSSIILAQLLPKFAYLVILFIFELAHTQLSWQKFANNGARETEFSRLYSGQGGEYSGVGFVDHQKYLRHMSIFLWNHIV